jgi:Zn-finger nucleic acid-binding protein
MQMLVACPACQRRYDTGDRPPGARFACGCGAEVVVPIAPGHDAPVVRCSACGAPRQGGERACRYCASEFTLAARDLGSLCPGCLARVSRHSRFCHSCGTPILAAQAATPGTTSLCPACPSRPPLGSRRLGKTSIALLECSTCGGLWIDREVFEVMADKARLGVLPEIGFSPAPADTPDEPQVAGAPIYRPCVICGSLMNRRNQGGKSRVVVDVCARHGIWFDLHELDRLLRFIREGGEERLRRRQEEEEREAERYKKLAAGLRPWADPREQGLLGSTASSRVNDVYLVERVIDLVSRGFSRLFDR